MPQLVTYSCSGAFRLSEILFLRLPDKSYACRFCLSMCKNGSFITGVSTGLWYFNNCGLHSLLVLREKGHMLPRGMRTNAEGEVSTEPDQVGPCCCDVVKMCLWFWWCTGKLSVELLDCL